MLLKKYSITRVILVAMLLLASVFALTGSTKVSAAPRVACSDTSHRMIAIDNSQSGDGNELTISCISDDGSTTSTPSLVGSGGEDVQLTCVSGSFQTSTTTSGGLPVIRAVCPSGISSYFNGTQVRSPGPAPELGFDDANSGSQSPEYVSNDCGGSNIQAGQSEDSENHCGILDYLVLFINVLSALAGVVIAGSIAYGGIQYSMAGSDPQKVTAAKSRIRNALIALLFFIFGFGFINYLVPGGLL